MADDVLGGCLAAAQDPLNAFPPKLALESLAMGLPTPLALPLGRLATLVAGLAPPALLPQRARVKTIGAGDRVVSTKHRLAHWPNFGGYVLAVGGAKALVMWDLGVLTVDDLTDLNRA